MLGTQGSTVRIVPLRRNEDDDKAAALGVIHKAAERLELVIDQETAALKARTGVNLKDFNDRKSLSLLELTRAMRHIEGAPPDLALQGRLSRLRDKLEINRTALKMHLDAVKEIANIVADAMRDAESDGTYSPSIRGGASP